MPWQDVNFAGGLNTALAYSAAPPGTLAECRDADVSAGDLRRASGLLLLGTPADLAVSPVVKAIGWGQHDGVQELLYAVTNNSGNVSIYKWAPGDGAPTVLSSTLDAAARIVIARGALGKYVYVCQSKSGVNTWYRHELGRVPPHAEAFKKVRGASSVAAPASITYKFEDNLPKYQKFGTTGEGSSVAFTSTGTAPTSVVLGASGTHVKVTYPTSSEPGSEVEITVTLAAFRQFLIDFNDAMAMLFLVRNCTLDVRYIELETSGGATWRGFPWGATGGGGHVATSWVLQPTRGENRSARDTEKVTKVRFKFALATANSSATPEIWIDSPNVGGTFLWFDPWLTVEEQPLKYAASYIDNNGDETDISAITEVPTPEEGGWHRAIGTHLILTPATSGDALMTSGSIVIWRALRVNGDREERWFKMATIANNPASPNSATDKYLPREHSRNMQAGIDEASFPARGEVYAISPHQQRLFIGIDNEVWVSAMNQPEVHVVDTGFDPLTATAPDKHFASLDQSAKVTGFASGDALIVTTDKGVFMEFGWPDRLAYQIVKVFDEPCTATIPAIEAMGAGVISSTMGAYGVTPNGAVQEVSDAIRQNLAAYSVAWHRGQLYLVNGTSLFHLTRTGAWVSRTLGKSVYGMYGGFSNLDYVLCVGNDGKLYGLDPNTDNDDGTPLTWRVKTNLIRVPDHAPTEIHVTGSGTAPTVRWQVPGRSEQQVTLFGQAGLGITDFNGLGVQLVIEGAADTVVDAVRLKWEPIGDRPMQGY